MPKTEKWISPIAIDLGAKNTGVYYAHYKKGTKLSDVEKDGEVLEWGNYTTLLKERTKNRHIRRNYQRRKLAKRLLFLILREHFKFSVEKHTQAIGFFVNRRGYNRLEKNYSQELLGQFPDEAWELLPDRLKEELNRDDLAESLEKIANQKEQQIVKYIKQSIEDKIKPIKKELVYWNTLSKISDAINKKLKGEEPTRNKKDKKLSGVSKWIIERAIKDGIKFEKFNHQTNQEINILDFLNRFDDETLKNIRQSLPSNIQKQKKDLQNNEWNFNPSSFDLEGKEDSLDDPENENYIKSHLQHLCFAIDKICDERLSGGRHRNSFFKEIKSDLEQLRKNQRDYLKRFGDAIFGNSNLDIDKMFHLIAHVSNLELKPLRAYFNSKTHRKTDQWDLKKLSQVFGEWILNHWRVSVSDGEDKKQNYKKLKKLWDNHNNENDAVSFWIETCPELTIPPYQDIKNRRPPKCQTLILNQIYLDKNYPDWKKWLETLVESKRNESFLREYENKLKNMKSQKQKPLINSDEINLRKLQLILDTSKDLDSYKLNDIWSTYHQMYKGNNRDQLLEEYKEKIEKSNLSKDFKDNLLLGGKREFEKRTFGHFINKYYQTRRKTRDGRYFLHQIKKNKWSDEKFLKICTHKPRQKKYQLLYDLVAIFGVELEMFKNIIGWNDQSLIYENIKAIEEWFKKEELNLTNKKLERFCKDTSDAQKKYRGRLKHEIEKALSQQINNELNTESKKLAQLDKYSKEFSKKIAKVLWPGKNKEDQYEQAQRFESVFCFAQIYNIVFKDRSGFSSTCPVCSLDNSKRMEVRDNSAYACRLSGLSIRLIDGAVMRVCDRLGNYIIQERWPIIRDALKDGQKVCIPLIMEQNSFAFEPALSDIKGKRKKKEDDRKKDFSEKIERIKSASNNICPYTGNSLGDTGEIDHIIPQASKHGTLNDEANLIYASKPANAGKTNTQYSLSQLNSEYEDKIFKTNEFKEIKEFIYKNLLGENQERENNLKNKTFIFRKYQSFIQLNEDQRKAFRHALFLKGDPLREMVINAISNRNRAIVNGTQRYFAQIIADKFYQKAKETGKEGSIEFDYFEYTSEVGKEKSIYELRDFYLEKSQENSELDKNSKERGKKQTAYSHLLDAQMAFLLACDEHRERGTMGICFDVEEETIRQGINIKTGEILPLKYFDQTHIPKKDIQVISINRKKLSDRPHRSYTRDSFYADHYLPFLLKRKKGSLL